MDYADIHKVCTECAADFIFFAGEQAYFAKKGLEHPPKRCGACRAASKARKQQEDAKDQ